MKLSNQKWIGQFSFLLTLNQWLSKINSAVRKVEKIEIKGE